MRIVSPRTSTFWWAAAVTALLAIERPTPASANRIIVDQNAVATPGVFTSVQQAINDSGTVAGDEVFVRAGVYREAISLSKNITLACEGPHLVELRNDLGDTIVAAVGAIVTIKGCRITGSGNGIVLRQDCVATILNNVIVGNGVDGIASFRSSPKIGGSVMRNNVITSNSYGIHIDSARCGFNDPCCASVPSVTVENNILYANRSRDRSIECVSSVIVQYNNAIGNATNFYLPGKGSSEFSEDPSFVDPSRADFRLLATSTSRDRGNPTEPDPDGTRNDLGAFGGPDSWGFFPPLDGAGPSISAMSVEPNPVDKGGTVTLRATGRVNVQ